MIQVDNYIYLLATLPFLIIWVVFFVLRPDVRREMTVMSVLIGILSILTAYHWWTVDWWHPTTITGTRVGIEDFLSGFSSGGIMAVVYEIVFKKHLYQTKRKERNPSVASILLLLAFLTAWLFWGVGLTSFWASSITLVLVSSILFYFRKDLFINGILSGVLMVIVSVPSYLLIVFLSPEWIAQSYYFDSLTGILFFGIPIEEFVFWFLAGLLFGPFYEYWKDKRLRKIPDFD